MKNILRIEEAAMFGLCIYALSLFHVSWWVYLLLLIAPDISIAGYGINKAVGAVSYNLFHHKGIAVVMFVTGFILRDEWMQIIGIILFGHSSMDRMFGFGLKLPEGFNHTHLEIIGKK
jgi:hypothetical protein